MVTDFQPAEQLTSDYRHDLRALLEAKLKGQEISRPEPVEEEPPAVDLMEALRRSVEEARKRKEPAATARRPGQEARGVAQAREGEVELDAQSVPGTCLARRGAERLERLSPLEETREMLRRARPTLLQGR